MHVVTIVGAGMMGSALVFPARKNGNVVRLVGTVLDDDVIAACRADNRHPKFTVDFPAGVEFYTFAEFDKALPGSDFVICGVSSFGVDWFAEAVLPALGGIPVLSVTKGLFDTEDGRLLTYPEYWNRLVPDAEICAIGGACTSYELVAEDPTVVTYCGKNRATLEMMRQAMETDYYYIALSDDIRGVETAVALKNAYAFGVTLTIGINERRNGKDAKQHYNSQAAAFAQGAREMRRLIAVLGGGADSVDVGIGDLYVTVFSGRTRLIGTLLGRGLSLDEALRQLEGITLESNVVSERVGRALSRQAAAGKIAADEYPMMMLVYQILTENRKAEMPWKAFRGK